MPSSSVKPRRSGATFRTRTHCMGVKREMLRTMHLFAGAGGGLLADLILGHKPRVAVEWDAYCCQVLRERAADGWFPGLHVYEGDIRLFDPSEYAGSVDCIAAGFPCQDISVAGKGAGIGEGTRSGLYREVLRIAGIVRPRYLWLENVAAIVPLLGTVVGDLAALGYDCRWCCLRASAVGAPHRRDRWWCIATMADSGCGRRGQQGAREVRQPRRCEVVSAGEDVADAARERCKEERPDSERSAQLASSGSPALPDPILERLEGQQQAGTAARPVDRSGDGRNPGWWSTEPDVLRVAHGVAARVHRLKALGNGQVPIQSAAAWMILGGPQ
ncbi:MAG: DNA cytosine methyltransferase [Vulcanimicrobiaceae bacterium]